MLNEKLLPDLWTVALQMWRMSYSFPLAESLTADGSDGANAFTRRGPPSSGHRLPSHLFPSLRGKEVNVNRALIYYNIHLQQSEISLAVISLIGGQSLIKAGLWSCVHIGTSNTFWLLGSSD